MEYISTVMNSIYDLFDSVTIPIVNVSALSLFLGIFGAYVSIVLLKMFFGLGNTATSGYSSINTGRGVFKAYVFSQRGGNNKNVKISKERKNDEH